jgi:hypothetical protein
MKCYDSIHDDINAMEKERLVDGGLVVLSSKRQQQQCCSKKKDNDDDWMIRSNPYVSGYILMGVLFFGVALGFSFGFLAGIQYWKQIDDDNSRRAP